jgi:hypothetical protein
MEPRSRPHVEAFFDPATWSLSYLVLDAQLTTVAEERARNIHVRAGLGEEEFVAMRTRRGGTLDMPELILPAVQANMRAGRLPEPEDNGVRCPKIPLDAV